MNKFNNMGGILFAHLLFIDQINLFSVVNNQVIIRTHKASKELNLPLINISSAPVVTPETADAGTCYKIAATIQLHPAALSSDALHTIRTINNRGCLLLYQDASGYKKVIGSQDHPLFATLTEKNGNKPTDFSGFELTLTGKTIHPQLPYITI